MPEHPQERTAQRQQRDGAIRATFVTSVVGRVFSSLCSLAQVPLALAWLGNEGFGLWITLISTTFLLSASDLGLGLAMQNQVTEALGRNRPQRVPALVLTTLAGLVVISGLVLGAGLLVIRFVDWTSLFHLTQPALIAEAADGARAALLLFSVGLPLAAAARLASACQWGWLTSIWNAVGVAGQLLAIGCAGRLGLSFPGFVLFAGSPLLLANAGLLLHAVYRLRWRWRDLGFGTAPERRILLHHSWDFCLQQASAAFIYNAAAPLIGAVAGVPAVAAYNVVQRLFGLFGQLQQMALNPLWPAYAEAAARADHDWIDTNYRRSLRLTLVGIAAPLVGAAFLLPWIIPVWIGAGTVMLPAGLIGLLCAWNVILALSNPPACLLGGLGRMRWLGRVSLAGCLFAAGAMLALGSRWGANGVVAGLIASYLLIILPGTYLEANLGLASLRPRPRGTPPPTRLPAFLRQAVMRALSGPPAGATPRKFAAAIYKVDRVGDFVLALGVIRRLTEHFGPEQCLLIISPVVEPIAAREFPRTPRVVIPVNAGSLVTEMIPAAWRHRRKFAGLACTTLVCLRHQREGYHDVTLSWLAADHRVALAPADYPATEPYRHSAELAAHRLLLGRLLGREVPAADLLPAFTTFAARPGTELLVCPFSADASRNLSGPGLVAALAAWQQRHPGPIRLNGSPDDRLPLEALRAAARAAGVADIELSAPSDLPGFIEQIAAAGMVLTADSAAAHVGTTLDKPVVVLQGGAFAGMFGPWHRSARQAWVQHPLPCFGCASHCTEADYFCLTRITTPEIVAALEEVSR